MEKAPADFPARAFLFYFHNPSVTDYSSVTPPFTQRKFLSVIVSARPPFEKGGFAKRDYSALCNANVVKKMGSPSASVV